jgi:hypothetical protein
MLQTDVSRPLSVLWDVGYYEIGYPTPDDDSDSNQERRKKRRREEGEHDEDDPYVAWLYHKLLLTILHMPGLESIKRSNFGRLFIARQRMGGHEVSTSL